MVVVKWCKCLNLKLCLVNPPTPVADIKWITENTSMKKCGESKVQGNVVTMELDKMVQTRMVSGWQVWKCFNCNIDVCAIDMNNNVALVNMEMEDNDDVAQLQLDSSHIYSDCFGVVVDTATPSDDSSESTLSERDPHSIENFNRLQQHVDAYLADAERVMEKRIRQYIKEQNEVLNQLRSRVNAERTIIWRKMCSVANSTVPPVQPTLSSTPSATTISAPTTPSATTNNASAAAAAATQRARAGSVSRPHSRSVSGAVAPFASGFVGSVTPGTPVSNDKPVLGSTFGTISGFNVPGSAPIPKPNIAPEVPYTPEPSVPPLPTVPQPVTPPKTEIPKPESGTKWQAAPRPGSGNYSSAGPTTTKRHIRRSSSPSIFSFDDEEDDAPGNSTIDDSSDDDIVEEYKPTISHPPKIPDSINLLGSSLPVAIPARMNPTHRAPPPTTTVASTPKRAHSNSTTTNATVTGSPSTIAPTTVSMSTVSMSTVSMATVSSTAPTHQYHALKPQSQTVAPLSSSASTTTEFANSDELMVPKQSWRENFLGEAAEESLPAEMASSFIIPLSLNRRLKSLI